MHYNFVRYLDQIKTVQVHNLIVFFRYNFLQDERRKIHRTEIKEIV